MRFVSQSILAALNQILHERRHVIVFNQFTLAHCWNLKAKLCLDPWWISVYATDRFYVFDRAVHPDVAGIFHFKHAKDLFFRKTLPLVDWTFGNVWRVSQTEKKDDCKKQWQLGMNDILRCSYIIFFSCRELKESHVTTWHKGLRD